MSLLHTTVTRWFTTAVLFLTLAASGFAIIGAASQMQLGNPSSATIDPSNHAHYLIQRDQYALDYNDTTHEPNWVSWDLTSGDIGSSGRGNFMADTTLPDGFYQVQTTDYSGSGYDRGHMCPSADRTVTVYDNSILFYMSNMIPQTPDNNQGVWASFESYCRTLASAGNEVLITSGPSGFAGSTIASGVAIPGYTWKIAVVVPLGSGTAVDRIVAAGASAIRVIAVKIPNIAGVRSTPWENFVTSPAQIQADTGYTFFTNLPAPIASAFRSVVDGSSSAGSPVITGQPTPQTTVVGGTATFAVTVTGDAPFSYQWSHDDVDIPGATDATLTLGNVQAADVGSYYVVVTNDVASTTSNAATLVVTGLPPVITAPPASQTVSAGTNVTLAVTVTGSPTLVYQWRKAGTPINGATASTLTLVNVQAGDAGSYDVFVSNSAGIATSAPALLTVNASAPAITSQPVSRAAVTADNASFTVTASGSAPLAYQWRKEGTPLADGGAISGTATATLLITGVTAANGGNYDVVVTNTLGTATSAVATLTVNPPPPSTVFWDFGPAAAPIATPTSGLTADITGGTVSVGNNNGTTPLLTTTSVSTGTGASGAVNAGAATINGAYSPATSTYFTFTLAPGAGKRLLATGFSFRSRSTGTGPQNFAIYSSVDGFTNPLATGVNTGGTGNNWVLYTLAFTTITGQTDMPITFRIYGYNGAGATGSTAVWRIDDLKLTVSAVFPPPVAPVVTATSPVNGATGVAVTDPVTVTFNEAVGFAGSWFTINSAANGPLTATVQGGPFVYTLATPSGLAFNDTITVSINGSQVVDQASGTIHGTANTTFSFTTQSYVPPTPPAVTGQPSAQTVFAGGSANFTVTAAGTAPLSYQWRKNGTPISGNSSATTAALALAGVTTADAGSYSCVVTNVAGSDVSSAATLTVNLVPASITTQPGAQLVAAGGTATFTVGAAGTAPLTFQWRHNGLPVGNDARVTGANTATLTITGVSLTDNGTYDVTVANPAGSATSNTVQLAVSAAAPGTIYWDFTTASPTSGVPAGVTGGTVTQGNNNGTTALLTTTSASTPAATFSGGNNAGAAARIGALVKTGTATTGSAYFEFTFTPDAGQQFAATALSFGARSTGTGPQAYAVFSSADGFINPLATGPLLADSTWRVITTSFAGVTGAADAPVTFRIYGYSGTGSPSASTANWRVDDLRLTAAILATPPVITTQPVAQTVTVGDNVLFTVAADGSAPLTYQWRLNGVPLLDNPTATTDTLALAGVVTAQAGDYDCVVTNAVGSATSDPATLAVNKAQAAVALGTLDFVYTGAPAVATVTTVPAGLTVTITYDGSPVAPANAGSYNVVATIDDADYFGTASGTLTVAKAAATVTLGGLNQTYDGTAKLASAGTNPGGLGVVLSYDGGATAPVNAGSYAVTAVVNDQNYAGAAGGTLVIAKAAATVTLGGLNQTYDGAAKPATAVTAPAGLTVDFTYNGSTAAPANAGSYAVVGAINNANYTGTASGTLVIAKAVATVTLTNLSQIYDGAVKPVTVVTAPAGLNAVTTYNGNATAPSAVGSYLVVSTIQEANYTGTASNTLVISQAVATVTLSGLVHAYDGTPKPATVVTNPANLTVKVTYDGSITAPTYPGSYAVVATTNDPSYQGTANGTLVITTTAIVRHAPVLNGGIDGSLQVMLPESTTLNGSALLGGDLLVPGTPAVQLNGHPVYAGPVDANGSSSPSNYQITINGNAALRHVVRRVNAITLPVVAAPPAPAGTRSVSLNNSSQSPGDFTTLRNLTLNSNVGLVAVPAGTYGTFTVNGNSGLILGVAGATQPAVYNLQGLTVNSNSQVEIVGPVIINLANGVSLNSSVGDAGHPEWLVLNFAAGGLTLNGNVACSGYVTAPAGTVTINGNSTLNGGVISDGLTINGNGLLQVEDPE